MNQTILRRLNEFVTIEFIQIGFSEMMRSFFSSIIQSQPCVVNESAAYLSHTASALSAVLSVPEGQMHWILHTLDPWDSIGDVQSFTL
jgi:hypothetical protein